MKKLLLATTALVIADACANAQVANISTTDLTLNGISSTAMQAAPSPTYFWNDGDTFLAVQQAGTAKTATVRTAAAQVAAQGYGLIQLSDQVVNIPSGTGVVLIGPFPTGRWNIPANSTVKVDWSAPVSVTAVRLPQ